MAPKAKDKPKAVPTPSQPPPPIEDLFTTLNKHIEGSEYVQTVKVANQILSVSAGDEDALRCKVVALVKDDRIDEALSTIHSNQRLPVDFEYFKVGDLLGLCL